MNLDTQQKSTLKASLLASADPTIISYLTARNDDELTKYINATDASPTFVVWKNNVTAVDFRNAIVSGRGITQLDGLSASKRDSLFWYIGSNVKPSSLASTAIDDLCGTQNTLKSALQASLRRNATIFEKIFCSGTGTTNSPGTMEIEGPVSLNDVSSALNS